MVLALTPSVAKGAGTVDPQLSKALDLYVQGHVLDAAEIALKEAAVFPISPQAANAIPITLFMCNSARSISCLEKLLLVLAPHFAEKWSVNPDTDYILKSEVTYSIAWDLLLRGQIAALHQWLPANFVAIYGQPTKDPENYIDFQLLAAALAVQELRFPDAQRSVSRALGVLLSVGNLPALYVADALNRLIKIQAASGNATKAIGWWVLTQPLMNSLVPTTPEAVDNLQNRTIVFSYLGASPALAQAIQAAIDGIQALQIDSGVKIYQMAPLIAHLVCRLLLDNQRDAALKTLANNPVSSTKKAIISRGTFQYPGEFFYALAELFTHRLLNQKIDPAWGPLFAKPFQLPYFNRTQQAEFEVYARFAQALLTPPQDPTLAQRLVDTGKVQVRVFQEVTSDNLRAFPVLDDVNRLLSQYSVAAIAEDAVGHNKGVVARTDWADLLLKLTEIQNRSLPYALSDTLSVVSEQPTESGRRLAHSALRLIAQEDAWQADQIQNLVQRTLDAWKAHAALAAPTGMQPAVVLQDFSNSLERVIASLRTSGRYDSSARQLPNLSQLQSTLAPKEAYLTLTGSAAGAVKLCVTKSSVFVAVTPIDARQLSIDTKLLQYALTDQRPASDVLDSQYPARKAVELYHFIFDGLESCLTNVRHIVFASPPELTGLPLAVLLSSMPPVLGDGFDLGKAHWLALKFEFSYVPSLQGYLAAAQSARWSGGQEDFLGVGDPILGNAALANFVSGQQLASTTSGGALDLKPLPETSKELNFAQSQFDPARSTLLLNRRATEENFRMQPLSRFNVIEFATHALVPDDLTGLDEMALVLTPGSDPTDRLNDGFLRASELASLELRARLVVLSACNTAKFDVNHFTAEIQGLTLALAQSGVPTVIGSLWPVDSVENEALMEKFYSHLKRAPDAPLTTVLASAQREIFNSAKSRAYFHPRFWAPYIIMGYGSISLRAAESIPSGANVFSRLVGASDQGSEVLSVVALRERGLFGDSAIGPTVNGHHKALLELRKVSGDVIWTKEADADGAGPVSAGGDRLFWATYHYFSRDHVDARITAFDLGGKQVWSYPIPHKKPVEFIRAIASGPGGRVAAVSLETSLSGGSEGSDDELWLSIFDSDGKVMHRQLLDHFPPYGDIGYSNIVSLAYGDGPLLVTVNEGRRVARFSYTDFRVTAPCYGSLKTTIVMFDAESYAEKGRSSVTNFAVEDISPDQAGWLLSGEQFGECDPVGHAAVEQISGNLKLKPIWVDAGPFSSSALAAIRTSHGFRIVKAVERKISIDPHAAALSPGDLLKFGTTRRLPIDYLTRKETEVVDISGETERTLYLDAGLGLSIRSAAIIDSHLALVGSLGPAPIWYTLQ